MNKDNKKFAVIIPARGGSKRFPGKNLHSLNGKPLIAYPIEAAQKAKLVDRIIVSTDDNEIAKVARQYGAEFPFARPVELAGDTSPVIEAIVYTVEELERRDGYHVDYIILLQSTTPIIESEQIDKAIKMALESNADSVVAVAEVETICHPYNVREIKEDGTIKFWQEKLHYDFFGRPKPKFYKPANLWLSSYETLIKERRFESSKRNIPLLVEPIYCSDIDFKEDLESVELWMKADKNRK